MRHILLAALGVLTISGTALAQEQLRIGTEGAYAPWNFIDESGELAGYEIDLGNAICEKIGRECVFVANEWDSIIPNLIASNYDVIMAGMSITDERKQSIDFSQNYYPPDPSQYLAPAGAELDFDNLSGKRIGVQSATIQAGHAEETFGASNTVLSYATNDQAVADLSAGNLDVVLADGSYLEPIAENSGGALEIVGPEVMLGGGVGAGLRQADDELEQSINTALTELKADGTVDALIKQWFDAGPFFADGAAPATGAEAAEIPAADAGAGAQTPAADAAAADEAAPAAE